MATNLEEAIEMIRAGLETQAVQNIIDNGSVRSGFLRDNTEVAVEGDDFIVSFPFYGEFIDQGTRYIEAKPFYSNLVITGPEEGQFEDDIEAILEEAFNQDVEQLDNNLDEAINE